MTTHLNQRLELILDPFEQRAHHALHIDTIRRHPLIRAAAATRISIAIATSTTIRVACTAANAGPGRGFERRGGCGRVRR